MAFRYMLLMGHYRQPLDFSFEALDAASTGYKNVVRRIADLMSNTQPGTLDHGVYDTWHNKILEAVSDNMKTATALVLMQDMLKDATVNPTTKLALFEFIDRLLGRRKLERLCSRGNPGLGRCTSGRQGGAQLCPCG